MNAQRSAVSRWLRTAILIYLAVPGAIFIVGWLRWPVAVVSLAALAVGALDTLRRESRCSVTMRQAWVGVGVSLLCLLLSGIGGLGVLQQPDWRKHNAMLLALTSGPWPTSVGMPDGSSAPLVYYIAYLLPAALAGKVAGWTAANITLVLWLGVGLALAFLLFAARVSGKERTSWAGALVPALTFMLFSGLDIVGTATIAPAVKRLYPFAFPNIQSLELWGLGFMYNANATLVAWVPNQAIGGWLAAGLVFSDLEADDRSCLVWYLALALLWSPFAALGLLLYIVLGVIRARLAETSAVRDRWQCLRLAVAGRVWGVFRGQVRHPCSGTVWYPTWLGACTGTECKRGTAVLCDDGYRMPARIRLDDSCLR